MAKVTEYGLQQLDPLRVIRPRLAFITIQPLQLAGEQYRSLFEGTRT